MALVGALKGAMLSKPAEHLFPVITAVVFNRVRLASELGILPVPNEPWAQREAREILRRSEERLRGIEAKGPGLATVNAVVAAAVLVALSEGWGNATLAGQVLLAATATYALMSLTVPIYLVGPIPRSTIDLVHIDEARASGDPEDYLARHAVEAAQANTRATHRLVNLQDAARGELVRAAALLSAWVIVGPLLGIVTTT